MSARFSLRWWAARLSLSGAAFLLTLGVLELGLRLLGYEAAAEVASEPSLFWRHDELLGWSNEPGVSATFIGPRPYPVEFRAPVTINSLGLRGPELAPLPPDGLRVLLLGDSLVASFEVSHEESFAALTQKQLARALGRPVQVLNAGVRGYGTDQSLLYFRERGRLLEPQLVVYMQSRNDVDDNMTLHRMRRPFGKPAFSPRPDGSLELVGTPVPSYPACSSWGLDSDFRPARLDGVAERGLCWVQLRLADHSALFTFGVLQVARSPALLELLRRIAAPGLLARVDGARELQHAGFGPLQLPAPEARRGRLDASQALTTLLIRRLAAEVRATGAEFIWVSSRDQIPGLDRAALAADGIEPRFLEPHSAPDLPIYFRNDSHLNWRGHELLASLLTRVLAERAQELFADAPCDVRADAAIAFSTSEPSDRIELHAAGSPCAAGSLALRVQDARGRELYRFEAPIEALLPGAKDPGPTLQRLVEQMAREAGVGWSELPDAERLPAGEGLELAVSKERLQRFREQRRAVLKHVTDSEGWQAVVFDGKQAVVILRAGL